jgi:ferrochelatase
MPIDPTKYDAILVLSFGGPEGPEEVMPFLENVTRGRGVPRQRLLEVAQGYHAVGGVSPINRQNRELIDALRVELDRHGIDLPIYFGNRNWRPLLTDTMRQMVEDGVRRVLAYVTSAFSSYSGCRQYREDIAVAQQAVGEAAPRVDKLRTFYNHPGFIEPMTERVRTALGAVPAERRDAAFLVFTAHSIPVSMSRTSRYVEQLEESMRLVCEPFADHPRRMVYQSRSGPPHVPWLEPDVSDFIHRLKAERPELRDVVIVPICFLSDHMEVIQDLDTVARHTCDEVGLNMVRAGTVGTNPRFIAMIRELIEERLSTDSEPTRLALGQYGPGDDVCPAECCPAPKHGGKPAAAER